MGGINKKQLKQFSKKITKIVDLKIKEILGIYVDKKTQKLLNYQIETGGKRFRPALAVVSCLVCEGKIKNILYPAAGLEILHNYSLIIDDIIDNSNLRREKPTTWYKFGRSIAQCISVDYSAAAFQAANRSKKPTAISELFAKTMKAVVKGEILDILFEQSGRENEKYVVKNRYTKITLPRYLKMVGGKTAALFQTCCEVGAICAKAKKEEIEALRNYGFNLGVAFQIQDDILDIFGKEKKFGKKIGKDIEERKLGNIVIFYALKELSQLKRKEVLTILRNGRIKNKDIKKVIKVIKRTRAEEKASLLGEKYIQKAKKNLDSLPKNKWNEVLNKIADFAIERNK